jgi:predicted DNA-binding ribbon-helix-helix protein
MPSSMVGKAVRRGRPKSRPTAVRSVRLPIETWKRLEAQAKKGDVSVNALIARRIG